MLVDIREGQPAAGSFNRHTSKPRKPVTCPTLTFQAAQLPQQAVGDPGKHTHTFPGPQDRLGRPAPQARLSSQLARTWGPL